MKSKLSSIFKYVGFCATLVAPISIIFSLFYLSHLALSVEDGDFIFLPKESEELGHLIDWFTHVALWSNGMYFLLILYCLLSDAVVPKERIKWAVFLFFL